MRVGLAIAAWALAALPVHAQSGPASAIVPPDRADRHPAAHAGRGRTVGHLPRGSAAGSVQPFVLTHVAIDGSSLPDSTFAPAIAPFLGKSLDAAQVQALVDALADIYERSDVALYTLVVPTQDHAGGVLRLTAVEGAIERVVVRGAGAKMRRLVGNTLAPLIREHPLAKGSLQRRVSLVRDIAGLNPDISFERGDQQGMVRLVVVAKPRPIQLAFGLNDRGTALLGKTQGEIDLYANSLIAGGDQLRLSYARPIRAPYYQAASIAYAVPLDADGLTLQVNAGRLKTRPRDIPIHGHATSLGGTISYAAIRDFRTNLVVSAGLDGVNSNNAFLGALFSNERSRALRLASALTISSDRNAFSASVSESFGLDAFGAHLFDPTLSELDFRKTNLRLADNLAIGKTFALRLNGAAQATGDRLPATEQFTLGGDEFGRAYETALLSGDTGYAGSAEFAWVPAGLPQSVAGSEIYSFVDGGHVRTHARAGFDGFSSHLGSWGGGARLAVLNRVVLQLEAARGFNNPVFYEDRRKWRLLFAIRSVL
ncbi:MAG TPA: ShlB/FhaC/HecB family hemolysin secretion/activation protein [Sphingomonas sp.]|uniref:ShlB/FhaC/HecB family hemolysin secretion/activation protein n=1 Tax=Sphingomonas sp. TaxID=28214 RepID=UPI002B7E2EF9|nr:ShlB/FhaC/HecB family hemolysin secretion/activation protein [Sphingomonas sp.]HMI19131.1 ShlB/FhaC/HecB family hemolysin secretion/activation protein [Sphingomonas sp.]